MAAPLMVNLDEVDFSRVEHPIDEVRRYIPQRFEMEQIGGVFKVFPEEQIGVGYLDVTGEEFWCRGHIPGRPLLPGVLMIEAGAQLATFLFKYLTGDDPNRFMGFGGADAVKFRGTVGPGQRLILLAKLTECRPRRCLFDLQGAVDGKLVFEGKITGLPV